MSQRIVVGCVVAAAAVGLATPASGQVLGTFRWQFAPYCNVATVRVEQKGAVYEFSGTDDGCDGAAPASTVNGSAHINANGIAGGSFTIVRPDSFVVTNTVLIAPATLSGTWKDDWGNSGTLVFNPPSPAAGNPRRLTFRGDFAIWYQASGAGQWGGTSISFPRRLNEAPALSAANVIAIGGAPTVNCPGTIDNPLAAPGQTCLYTGNRGNVSSVYLYGGQGAANIANPDGFSIYTGSAGVGGSYFYGRWAVTVP